MDNIAGVVCAAQIDDHGRHGQGPTSWMPCTRRAVLAGKNTETGGNMEKYRSLPGAVKHRHLGRTGEPWGIHLVRTTQKRSETQARH
jgi:hypothetical protein